MDPEMRKVYNSLYYKRNKDKILEKLTSKVNCEFCNRTVSFANLQKHYVPPICKPHRIRINIFPNVKLIYNNLIRDNYIFELI